MKPLYFSLFIFSCFLAVISAEESAPVLLWSSTLSFPNSNGLGFYRAERFSEELAKFVGDHKPMVIAFIEEDLSLEDFSIPDKNGELPFPELKKTTSNKKTALLSNVDNPTAAIRSLPQIGYKFVRYDNEVPTNLKSPSVFVHTLKTISKDVNRQVLLREHDSKIAEISEEFLKVYPNSLAIYAGRVGAWHSSNSERSKRETKEGEDGDEDEPLPEIIIGGNGFVLTASSLMYFNGTNPPKNYTTVTDIIVGNGTEGINFYNVTFTEGVLSFEIEGDDYQWELLSIIPDNEINRLIPQESVWGPREWSYYCSLDVTFQGLNAQRLVITNMQLQPDVEVEFGEPIDCIPYFTLAIWSGILITIVLLFILSWGVTMLMDINNNDRFDDPKGKTITISATD